jgi:hypothetical protein
VPAQTTLVITTISAPNAPLRAFAHSCKRAGWRFVVAGDAKTPAGFQLDGCRFLSLQDQLGSGFRLAKLGPTGHYSRKNIGYLAAIEGGAQVIVESDDDNVPRPGFTAARAVRQRVPSVSGTGWLNVYRYFSERTIWPRGLSLDAVQGAVPSAGPDSEQGVFAPIQQGLVDDNPDVDAVYRLLVPLPFQFENPGGRIAVGRGSWCPFNSQNTTWFREAFPLLYLPSHCSFRMTDIWRSLVAQRIAWEYGWSILFHGPTVRQERNEHDLLADFADEVPGYVHNRAIASALEAIECSGSVQGIRDDLKACYAELAARAWLPDAELALLEAWLADLEEVSS